MRELGSRGRAAFSERGQFRRGGAVITESLDNHSNDDDEKECEKKKKKNGERGRTQVDHGPWGKRC